MDRQLQSRSRRSSYQAGACRRGRMRACSLDVSIRNPDAAATGLALELRYLPVASRVDCRLSDFSFKRLTMI